MAPSWIPLALAMTGQALLFASASAADVASSPVDAVIVTARKQPEALSRVPVSLTVFSGDTITAQDLRSFTDIALATPNLSFAYGNGATAIGDARTVALRGMSGPNTTGLYVDDTPVPDSLDIHLVDLDRVEVLRGPQGTLFGESSLGGNVRFVTRSPSLARPSSWLQAEIGATSHGGSENLGVAGAGDVILVPDRVSFRVSGFWTKDAGYLTRTFPDPADPAKILARGDQGAQQAFGGAVAVQAKLSGRLTLDVRLIAQASEDHGFPAAFAPLPNFRPTSTLDRAFDVQPSVSDRWLLPSATLTWSEGPWRLASSTSWFQRSVRELEDSSTGTAEILAASGAILPSQPYAWRAQRDRRQLSHESRVRFDDLGWISGVAGVFYSSAHDDFIIPPISARGLAASGAWPNDLIWRSDIRDTQEDVAVFGETYVRLPHRLTLTLGARQYWLRQTYHLYADGFVDGGVSDGPRGTNAESGLSPKASLAWQASLATQVYLSAAKGFRAGGSGQAVIPACDGSLAQIGLNESTARKYDPDTVWSYEAGVKTETALPSLSLEATVYHLDWSRIQQSVFLPSCAFIITANSGAAAVDGAEIEFHGRPLRQLQIRAALGFEDARITKAGATAQAVGSRIYQTPRFTGSASVSWRQVLAGPYVAVVGADYSRVGDSLSANSGAGLTLVRPAYGLLNARLGLERGATSLTLSLRNLTNARPNLGDIGYIGYEQFAASGLPTPQVATLPPVNARLELRQAF